MNIKNMIFMSKFFQFIILIKKYYKNSIFFKILDKIYILFTKSYVINKIIENLKNNKKNDINKSFIVDKILIYLDKLMIFLKLVYKKYFYKQIINSFFCIFINNNIKKIKNINFLKKYIFCYVNFQIFFILSVFVIFCIPDNFWNNIYILLISIIYLIIYLFYYFNDKIQKIDIKYIHYSLVIYILFCLLSLFTSFCKLDSLRISSILFSCIIFSILVTNIINNVKIYKKFIFYIFIAVFLTSLYGLYQFYKGIEIKLEFIDVQKNECLPGRLYSTMANPNNYAEFLIMTLPFCVSYIFVIKDKIKKIIFTLLLISCFLALILTFSRAAYLSLIGVTLIYILIIKPKFIPIFTIFFILLIPFIPKTIIMRISTIGKDSSSYYRVYIWEGILRLIKNYWLCGIGMGPESFKLIYKVYAHEMAGPAMHSHNVFLNNLVELGIGGFISLIIYILKTLKNVFCNFLHAKDKNIKYFSVSCISSLIGFIMFSLVEHVWFYQRVMLTFWLVIGLTWSIIKINRSIN